MMGLSIRAYARHCGMSHVTVKEAVNTGRITLLPDGTIDPDTADTQQAQNTLQPRKAATPEKVSPSKACVLPEREMPEPDTPPLSTGRTSLLQARTVNEVLRTQFSKVELAHRKKELVDRAQAMAHAFKLARVERNVWLNWSTCISGQMASTFGVDVHQMHMALEATVCEYLIELGELRPRVD